MNVNGKQTTDISKERKKKMDRKQLEVFVGSKQIRVIDETLEIAFPVLIQYPLMNLQQ